MPNNYIKHQLTSGVRCLSDTEGLPSVADCSPSGAALFSPSAAGAASGAGSASPTSSVGAATSSAGAASVGV